MPTWHQPKVQLNDALNQAMEELDQQITNYPSMDEVLGISREELTNHAVRAVDSFFSSEPPRITEPIALVQLYCMGFIIGSKFGAIIHNIEEKS